jgi:glutathione reductase (NADPH)
MKNSFPNTETYTFFKIIVDTKTDRVVGCHLATAGAGEMIQGVGIAIKMNGGNQIRPPLTII